MGEPRSRRFTWRDGDLQLHCVLCLQPFSGHGNNAAPLATGQCCNECDTVVTFVRLRRAGVTLPLRHLVTILEARIQP